MRWITPEVNIAPRFAGTARRRPKPAQGAGLGRTRLIR